MQKIKYIQHQPAEMTLRQRSRSERDPNFASTAKDFTSRRLNHIRRVRSAPERAEHQSGHEHAENRFIKPESIESKMQRRVSRSESLVDRHPELGKQWHESNFYEPSLFTPYSQQVSVWTCANGHVFVSCIAQRTRALDIGSKFQGCPVCAGRACFLKTASLRNTQC